MSDKPKIKPGDKFGQWKVLDVLEHAPGEASVLLDDDDFGGFYVPLYFLETVGLVPEPVEVREFWRVKYERYRDTPDGKGYYTQQTDASPTKEIAIERYRRRLPVNRELARNAVIEHVRETILSREEVQA